MEKIKPFTSDQVWYAGLATAWHRLTRPSPHIQNPTKRYKARVISGLLLFIFAVQAASLIFRLLVTADSTQPRGFLALLATGMLYLLSRTKYYDFAATLMILYFPVGITAVVLGGNSPVPEIALMGFMLSLFLGNILLSLPDLVRLGAINMAIIILLTWLMPENLPNISFVPVIIAFNAMATILIVASQYLQRQIETERLKALSESEERFRQLTENIHEALWIVTPGVTAIEYVSPTLEKVWGHPAQEFYEDPETFLRSIHPDDVETIVKPRLSQQVAGEPTLNEYRIIRPDGAVRWIWDRGFPLKDENGQVYRVMGIAEDITERKEASAKLRASQQLLATTQAIAKIGSWEFDLTTQRGSWSAQMYEIYERDPAWGAPTLEEFRAMIHPDDRLSVGQSSAKIQQGGEPQKVDFRIQVGDGRVKHIFATLSQPTADSTTPKLIGTAQDITERKQRELALRQSEERFSKLFSANPDALVLTRVHDGFIVDANKNTEHILGYKRDELMGQTVLDLNLYANENDRARLVQELQTKGTLRDFEVVAQNKSGHPRTLHVSIDLIDLDDAPHMLAVVRDMTEQKEMAAQLAYHAYILENMAEGLNYVDSEGNVLFTNPAFDAMFGYERGELVGQHVSVLNALSPAENEQFVAKIFHALQNYGIWVGEVRNRKKDGTLFITWAKIQALSLGQQSYWVTFQEDITERKRTEEALRESEARYRTFYNNTPVMMHTIDENFNFVNVSDYWLDIMGYEREEVIGLPGLNFTTEESGLSLVEIRPQLIETGWIKDIPCQFVKKNGEVIDVLLSSVVEKAAAGYPWRSMTVLVDVTERKRLEEQLRQAQKMEAIGQLTAGIAHDFNNLLTGINMTAELVQLRLATDDPIMEKLDRVIHAGELASNLINQLMIFSHKQILEPKLLDLNLVVDQISKLLRRIIGEHIDLKTIFALELWPITIDRSQMEQIIVNLAVNARDAMPFGGQLTIQTTNVQLNEQTPISGLLRAPLGDYVLLIVSDTGTGMSQAVQNQIFEPFFTTKEMGRGTGLGLATIHNIVKESGGDIGVESEEGQGTTFKIYLPRTEAVAAIASPSKSSTDMLTGDETILLVEDENSVRSSVSDILQMHGYSVLEASDGQEALTLAERHRDVIDLLITDVVMPGISGKTVAEQLSQSLSNLKILYMSGYSNEEISHHGVLLSGVSLLQKPFNIKLLVSKVRQVLDEPT